MNIASSFRSALLFLTVPSTSPAPLLHSRRASTHHLYAAFQTSPSSNCRQQRALGHHSFCPAHPPRRLYTASSTPLSLICQTMSRRSSRSSAAAAASKISGSADDGEDSNNVATENDSIPALKGSESSVGSSTKKATKKKGSPKKKAAAKKGKAKAASDDEDDSTEPKAKKKATPKKRKSKSPSASDDESSVTKKKSPKKKKAADHQRWTERTPLIRHWDADKAMASDGSYTFTVISWNVAGLRAFVKKQPDALKNLAERYGADVICLQEHKLQDGMLDDKKLKLREYFEEKLGDFEGHWSYSLEKKGYSGTAMFCRKRNSGGKKSTAGDGKKGEGKKQAKLGAFFGSSDGKTNGAAKGESKPTGDIPISQLAPIKVSTELDLPAHDGEGRTVIAEYESFILCGVYVPNSGQKLDRLGYRTEQWDADFLAKMQQLEKEGNKPVIWLGDLNVAHNEKDTWNEGAKHLAKSAGTTAEERASFERQLSAGYVDAFRHLHPEGRGHYSYWSQRAGNREPNKGLRLDYFICSEQLMKDVDGRKVIVRDSFMLPDELGSDHCPIVLEIEIKK